jgi:hypothetical protein
MGEKRKRDRRTPGSISSPGAAYDGAGRSDCGPQSSKAVLSSRLLDKAAPRAASCFLANALSGTSAVASRVATARGPEYARGMTWRFEHSANSAAEPQAVWRYYADVERWSEWSRQGATIDGPFEVGAKGKAKPPGSRPLKFRLVDIQADRSFTSEAKLPGARIRFEHNVEPRENGSRITHRATLDGPLAFLYTRPVRKTVKRGLADGVERLAALAASGGRT